MSAAAHITLVVASVNTTELLIQKTLLQSYLVVVNYLYIKFSNNHAIAETDFKILR